MLLFGALFKLKTIVTKISTGTRIRTQIKGFGDPYATVAPCPYEPKVSGKSKRLNQRLSVIMFS